MPIPEIYPLSSLNGQNIVRWVGHEMALSGGDHNGSNAPVLWEHDSMPFRQFTSIDMRLADDRIFRLLSQYENGTDFYGLYLIPILKMATPDDVPSGNIYRTRELRELPTGICEVAILQSADPASMIEAKLFFAGTAVRLLSAEVHERADGRFEMMVGDGAIPVQVNDPRPALAIEGERNDCI